MRQSVYNTREIIDNYHSIKKRMEIAAESVNRNPTEITLIAVTKTYNFESIKPLIDIGHRNFGENRVQEADSKWSPVLENYEGIQLHLIGHLQSNKTKRALELFNSIHTIDSKKLLNEIKKNIQNRNNKCSNFFIEINMANEEQKAGIAIDQLSNFHQLLSDQNEITCEGLMCIPPFEEEPSPYFALLHKVGRKYGFKNYSMGMSADFEKAIQFGATHIRVGSEIFGHRQ
jgi:pyridoxal phosphate enzyme (YggS family)